MRIHPARTLLAIAGATILHAQAPKRLPIITGEDGLNLIVEVDGTVKSWGLPADDAGFYGDGSETVHTRLQPVPIPGVRDIIDAAVGRDHALLLKSDGTLLGWGRNNGCALALPDDHRRYKPVPIPGVRNVKQIAAGLQISAAVLNDGTVLEWGEIDDGLLPNRPPRSGCLSTPTSIPGLTGVKRIVFGGDATFVLKDDGTVWGWGWNKNGDLCDGTTENRKQPVQMKGIANAVDFDYAGQPVIVLADGTVWMCGKSSDGSMADAAEGSVHTTPFRIAGITTAVAARSTMVRLKDGTLLGWGYGVHGSLGDGFVDKIIPKPHAPIGLGPVLVHYYASNEGYAIKADGTVMRWGYFTYGRPEWALKPVAWYKTPLP